MDNYSHHESSYSMADSLETSKLSGTNEIIIPLEYGFTKKVVQRRSGTSAGKYDVYIYSPRRERFRSLQKLQDHVASHYPKISPSAFGNAFLVPQFVKNNFAPEPVISLNKLTENEIKAFSPAGGFKAGKEAMPLKNLTEVQNIVKAKKHKESKGSPHPGKTLSVKVTTKRKPESKKHGGQPQKRSKEHDKKGKHEMSQEMYIKYLKKNIVAMFAQARYKYMSKKRRAVATAKTHSPKTPKVDHKENGPHRKKTDSAKPKKDEKKQSPAAASTSQILKSNPDIIYL